MSCVVTNHAINFLRDMASSAVKNNSPITIVNRKIKTFQLYKLGAFFNNIIAKLSFGTSF